MDMKYIIPHNYSSLLYYKVPHIYPYPDKQIPSLSYKETYPYNYNDVKKDISCQRYLHFLRFSIADHQCNHASF